MDPIDRLQRIIWLDAGHYSAVLYLVSGLGQVVEHSKVGKE